MPREGPSDRKLRNPIDGYLFLYEEAFDPGDQLDNMIAADDDHNDTIFEAAILGIYLRRATKYILVTSAFDETWEGENAS